MGIDHMLKCMGTEDMLKLRACMGTEDMLKLRALWEQRTCLS